MPFLIVPEGGGIAGGKPELYLNYGKAREIAEHKAVQNPGTRFVIFASVSSVNVPIPNPTWRDEEYAPSNLQMK
jgi:hypothetical protein